jgi:hypothetical protein
MKKGISVDRLLLILAAFLIICSAPAMAGKIDPLLIALRAQQKDSTKAFIGNDGKEYISSPMPLSNLKDIMDISDDKGELTVYTLIQTNGFFNRFEEFEITPNSKLGNVYTLVPHWYPTQRVGEFASWITT